MDDTNEYRKIFWETLNELHDNSQASWDKLRAVYKPPEMLCRFRTVNENTLQQLQENKLYFSSADYYDDPFDTYFYINYSQVRQAICSLKKIADENNPEYIADLLTRNGQELIGKEFWIEILGQLKQTSPNVSQKEQELLQIKKQIQKQLYSICFCDSYKNETLWLKYAGNHCGFVLIYDMCDPNVFLCGKEAYCDKCFMQSVKPNVYPVYYSDIKYDATRYAIGVKAYSQLNPQNAPLQAQLAHLISSSLMWEIERISLIKKECHKYDREWRMLWPIVGSERPTIKMKPTSIALGLRMPEYERRLVVSAAKVAGIESINEMYIDDMDELQMRQITN